MGATPRRDVLVWMCPFSTPLDVASRVASRDSPKVDGSIFCFQWQIPQLQTLCCSFFVSTTREAALVNLSVDVFSVDLDLSRAW